jgi:hypothetical protein
VRRLLITIAAWLLAGACCDTTTTRIPAHYLNILEGLSFAPTSVTRLDDAGKQELTFQSDFFIGTFQDQDIQWSFSQANYPYGFWLEIDNRNNREIRLLWPDARYVDERGAAHEVYSQPRGPLPDDPTGLTSTPTQILRPTEISRPTVVPIYKQYFVASGCRNLVPYSEPLVPTTLSQLNEREARRYVDDVVHTKVPVTLVLPVQFGELRYEYTFEFILRER